MKTHRIIMIACLLGVLLRTLPVLGKNIPLKEVNHPTDIQMDDQNLYVVERSEILIYNLADFHLIKKFGKAGEGPGEFKGTVELSLLSDQLFTYSMGKIAFFNKKGDLLTEKIIKGGLSTASLIPFGKGFAGYNIKLDQGTIYRVLSLYNRETEIIRELARVKYPRQRKGDQPVLETAFDYKVCNNTLFCAVKKEFQVDVLPATQEGELATREGAVTGKPLFTILRKNYRRRPFTGEDETRVRNYFKYQLRERYERVKNRFTFPKAFPAVWFLLPADGRLFIFTWKNDGKKQDVFLYDMKGKFARILRIPVAMMDLFSPYPMTIKNERLYQLVENEEREIWELHIDRL